MAFSELIKSIRVQLGITQEQLCLLYTSPFGPFQLFLHKSGDLIHI